MPPLGEPTEPSAAAQALSDWPAPSACVTGNPGPRVLRRLSEAEYQQTLRAAFGPDVPNTTIFNDKTSRGYARDTQLLVVQDLAAQQLMVNAEAVAAWAVPDRLGSVSSCSEEACAATLIRDLGERMYRAPLTSAQEQSYLGLFAAEPTFVEGARTVLAAMLQSPHFLYHRELGSRDGSGAYRLDPFELASSLSFLLTGAPPDAELRQAARASALGTKEELLAHAARLLSTPSGHAAVYRMVSGWLDLERFERTVKDDAVFDMPDSLRAAMSAETRAFVIDQLLTQGASAGGLLTAQSKPQTDELKAYYGPSPRDPGLLGLGSVLTGFARAELSSPVQRGRLVRTHLLCQALPPPPQNVDTNIQPPAAGLTTRQAFAEHSLNPACSSCHRLMDGIGFGFEHYDAFGRYRAAEQGQPIDARGTVLGGAQGDYAFDGLTQLSQYLASTEKATLDQCALRYFTYYAFGSAAWSQDWCTYAAVAEHARGRDFSLRGVLEGIVASPRFRQRSADL